MNWGGVCISTQAVDRSVTIGLPCPRESGNPELVQE